MKDAAEKTETMCSRYSPALVAVMRYRRGGSNLYLFILININCRLQNSFAAMAGSGPAYIYQVNIDDTGSYYLS